MRKTEKLCVFRRLFLCLNVNFCEADSWGAGRCVLLLAIDLRFLGSGKDENTANTFPEIFEIYIKKFRKQHAKLNGNNANKLRKFRRTKKVEKILCNTYTFDGENGGVGEKILTVLHNGDIIFARMFNENVCEERGLLRCLYCKHRAW